MKLFITALTILSVFFYGCKGKESHNHSEKTATAQAVSCSEGHIHPAGDHDHNHEHEEEAHDHALTSTSDDKHSDEIIFTKAQASRTDFQVSEIHPRTFNQIIKTTGQILPAPGDESVVVATNNGIISYGNTSFATGSSVKHGQLLFFIASKNLAEGDYYSRINANYEKAKAEYERAQQLVKDRIISQKEFENIQLNYQNAELAYEAVSGKQSSKGVGIPSPLNGYIKNITVKDGEYVTVGQTIATISQNKRLVLRADVSEKHYKSLGTIHSANFETPYDNQVYTLADLSGKLLSVGKTAVENTFYIPVTFEFDNKGNIIPGSFVEVFLISSPIDNTLAIPVTALTNEMGTFYIYLQLDEEGYRKQEVKLGANNGKEVQIVSGLKPGDRVVTRGAYQVKMASASGAIPHGHEH